MAMTTPTSRSSIITPKITAACARSRIILPNMTIEAIGMMMIETTSRRLLHGLGFSNGWDEFGPKKPPPLVPSCLIETSAATGPRAIACSPFSSVLAFAAPWNVIGTPVATSRTATRTDTGTRTRTRLRIGIQVEIAQVPVAA